MFSPVLLLSIQERRKSKKNRNDKNYLPHLQFHLISPFVGLPSLVDSAGESNSFEWKSAALRTKE